MIAGALLVLFQVAPSPVASFAGVQTFQRKATATINFQGRSRAFRPVATDVLSLGANNNDGDNKEEDGLSNDQREGMANAFDALDGLNADDFDDLMPPIVSNDNEGITNDPNMEESAKVFMEMQAELSARGEDGVYDDILGDLTGDNPDMDASPTSYLETGEEDVTGLGQALDEAADILAADTPTASSSVLNDADGLGNNPETPLTTADVSNDVLTQDIQPSLSMEDFMTSAMQEAVDEIGVASEMSSSSDPGRTIDIAKTAEQLLEDGELREGIERIFDKAGEKLRLEVEVMKREQEAVTQEESRRGLEYLEFEKQRISEAEASVARMIQKVASETDQVQKAMEELELAKNDASGEGTGTIENTAIDLKKGGLIKQASLVGVLLFGSRAFTEAILVVGSPYGDQHFVPAAVQAAIALACAAYFFIVK
mmetsp:Transcript_7513/g.17042  ORF Transcript_7513/g.17042 Transcript_7513/m.17042 type:complete len:428 (+) Transcript_7513:109-1392(+)|eukprot:CAMPEP_0172297506 /NCGR_PEP_ID=MMETSP1058-20130122/501_1 /TAXON_ID=83371 /ORGANISM="Detonula confervacea, Strain CCMP 353" /LENGTH=427 /DNA_ID=CAMNT_0013006665 /DNA_START=59 /DNA_END=1342 /DNA_ORIENTATION=-